MLQPRRSAALLSVSALAVVALAGCGDDANEGGKDEGSAGGATQVAITAVSGDDGDECQVDTTSVGAGPVTFTVANEDAPGITEVELLSGARIVAEKENVVPGLPEVTFTVTLGGGDYEIYCPSAVEEKIPFTVTGDAAPAPTGGPAKLLADGATDYAAYVQTQVDGMVVGVQALSDAVDSGDLAAAQQAYAEARPFYEKVESDIEGFLLPDADPTENSGNLDYLIDMRASSLDPAVGWSGFHAVERDLFGRQRITDRTRQYAVDLVTNVTALADVAKGLTFRAEDLANGAAGLLEEVQSGKISGEEEQFSHLDILDFAGNVEGAEQAFEALRPGLQEIDPDRVATISDRFDEVNQLLERYKDPSALGGYRPYTAALRKSDAPEMSRRVQALAEALAGLAEKVATA
ncbi:iron uptake system protein EfeO [Nocardioides sp. MH1]|uniref:iron uptake system protein EfeO n=1 Tax=Nocardioides sp. MH1 TaxID=3242490 RepID=UPI00352123EC